MYENCKKLDVDINTLIPEVLESLGPYNVNKAFYNCQKLYGNVPAGLLWESSDRLWGNTSECFHLCKSLDLNAIPISWGGRMDDYQEFLVQVNWDQSDSGAIDYIRNKPNIDRSIQSDWSAYSDDDPRYIRNKPKIPTKVTELEDYEEFANVQANWDESDVFSGAYILNKPKIPSKVTDLPDHKEFANVQSDWAISDPTSPGYIRNKPEFVSDNIAVQNIVDMGKASNIYINKMTRNTVYICSGAITSLTINEVEQSYVTEELSSYDYANGVPYLGSMFESEIWFTVGITGATIKLPKDVVLIGNTTFHNGSSYVISIKNGLAVSVCYGNIQA